MHIRPAVEIGRIATRLLGVEQEIGFVFFSADNERTRVTADEL